MQPIFGSLPPWVRPNALFLPATSGSASSSSRSWKSLGVDRRSGPDAEALVLKTLGGRSVQRAVPDIGDVAEELQRSPTLRGGFRGHAIRDTLRQSTKRDNVEWQRY